MTPPRSGGRSRALRAEPGSATRPMLLAGAALMVAVALLGVGRVAAAQDASGAAASTAPASMAPASSPAVMAIPVTLADFSVTPNPIEAVGQTIAFQVVNDGPTPHNLTIRDAAGTVLGGTPDLSTGESALLTLTVPASGTYVTFCSLAGHESLGLKGELVVSEARPMGSPSTAPMGSPGVAPLSSPEPPPAY